MLAHQNFGGDTFYDTSSGNLSIPYSEYIRIDYFRWCHTGRGVNRFAVGFYKFWEYTSMYYVVQI
jgi:hypothetical protein